VKPVIESVDKSSKDWVKQRITFQAAYGGERVLAHLFLPKNVARPYQTVVYFPHLGASVHRSSEDVEMLYLDFIIKSGRALMFPIYKGTYERQLEVSEGPNVARDLVIAQSKDLGRSIDYLETRQDIDHERLAYYGISWGAALGPIFLSLEKRLKVAVLRGGYLEEGIPETETINFAPRVTIPVLMINGRYDLGSPFETSQLPMFRFLGTPQKDKRHVLFDTGHVPPRNGIVKETLDWLDRYLGPVR